MKVRIEIDGKTYEVEYDNSEGNPPGANPSSDPRAAERVQSLVLPTPQGPGSAGSSDIDESKVCRSPVAGIVSRIAVEVSQSVQGGDIVLVAEAMKMENNITAPGDAKVKAIHVKAGDTVKAGQILIEFE